MPADRGLPPRWAEIIAVGSELLVPPAWTRTPCSSPSGSTTSVSRFARRPWWATGATNLEEVFRRALERSEVVVLSGGLGPTDDDLTRDAVAAVLGRPLVEHEAVVESIRARFTARGARMPEVNRRQALVPAGAEVIENGWDSTGALD